MQRFPPFLFLGQTPQTLDLVELLHRAVLVHGHTERILTKKREGIVVKENGGGGTRTLSLILKFSKHLNTKSILAKMMLPVRPGFHLMSKSRRQTTSLDLHFEVSLDRTQGEKHLINAIHPHAYVHSHLVGLPWSNSTVSGMFCT